MTEDDLPTGEELDERITPLALFFPEVPAGEKILDAETLTMAERRTRVVELYSRHRTMRQIRDELRCSLHTVHHDLHTVLDGYKRLALSAASEHVADALMKLAHRETQLELDLDRSRGETVETTTSRRGKPGEKPGNEFGQATVKKKSAAYGNPKLHQLLLQCWDRRCRLLGLLKAEDFRTMAQAPVKLVAGFDPVDLV